MIESLGPLEGKYEIIEAIGEGGMGSVYKVRHKILDEIRVVKMMRSHMVAEEESKERFFREARIAAKARHRNIAQIFDFSVDEGVAFLIMEYIDGVTLQQALANHGKLSVPLAIEIAQQSLYALAFVHRMGIIHRDISPDNLMLTTDSDGQPRIKLIDLGLAKFTEADSGLTKEGFFLGKLRYASPEQFQTLQGGELGAWSDVYSFGLVFYELLTGHYPIKGRNLAEMMVGHVSEPPTPFSESDTEGRIPKDLRDIVLRAIEKKPDARFADGRDFREHVLAVQKDFPCGEAEKEEANQVRRKEAVEPKTPGSKTSKEGRLAKAFRADESSAGRATAATEAFESDSGKAVGDGAASGGSPSGSGGLGSKDRPGSTPGSKPPIEPTVMRQTPSPMDLESAPGPAGEAVRKMKDLSRREPARERPSEPARPSAEKPVKAERPTRLVPASGAERKPDPPTIPFKQRKSVKKESVKRASAKKESPLPSVTTEDDEPAPRRRRPILIAVAIVAVLAVAGFLLRPYLASLIGGEPDRPGGAPVVGTLVINALPWAEVVEVRDGAGEVIDLGGSTFTPLVAPLAPGTYTIVLRHGEFGERVIESTIAVGETTAEWVPLGEIDEDRLLRGLGVIE